MKNPTGVIVALVLLLGFPLVFFAASWNAEPPTEPPAKVAPIERPQPPSPPDEPVDHVPDTGKKVEPKEPKAEPPVTTADIQDRPGSCGPNGCFPQRAQPNYTLRPSQKKWRLLPWRR